MNNMKQLTQDQKKFYQENGYVVLDLLSNNEKDLLSSEYNKLFKTKDKDDLEATWKGDWKNCSEKTEVKSIHNLHMFSSFFTNFLLNKNILDACEDIMDTPNILLHHTKAHLKPPGSGSPFPMHQDYHYFPYEKDSMVAIFVSVDASDPENGGLCVYPGSHKLGPQEDVSTRPGWHYLDQKKFTLEEATPLTLKRGEVVIFSYLLVHGSYFNTSNRTRRMLLTQVMSAEDTPLSNLHISPCQKMVLRGLNPNRSADIKMRHNY